MRFLLLVTSLALTECLAGAGGGSAGSCYSDGPSASNVALSLAMAAVGAGDGHIIVSVSYDYRTRSGAKIIHTRYRVEDSNGSQLINAYIEKNLKGSGSYTFNVPIETHSAETFTVRVQAVDECFENSKWAEATFDVIAVAALAEKTGYATVTANGVVYFVGGMDANGQVGDALLQYDPATGHQAVLAPMPEGRAHTAAATIDGVIHVLGGTATVRDGLIFVDGGHGLQAYDPVLDLWTRASQMPAVR